MITQAIQVLSSFIGALGFSILFNVRGKKLFFAGLGGLVSWTVYLIIASLTTSTFIPNFAASMAATVYAEALARLAKSPATIFDRGNYSFSSGRAAVLYDELRSCKKLGFVHHVWTEDSDHRYGGVRRHYDDLLCLSDL